MANISIQTFISENLDVPVLLHRCACYVGSSLPVLTLIYTLPGIHQQFVMEYADLPEVLVQGRGLKVRAQTTVDPATNYAPMAFLRGVDCSPIAFSFPSLGRQLVMNE